MPEERNPLPHGQRASVSIGPDAKPSIIVRPRKPILKLRFRSMKEPV